MYSEPMIIHPLYPGNDRYNVRTFTMKTKENTPEHGEIHEKNHGDNHGIIYLSASKRKVCKTLCAAVKFMEGNILLKSCFISVCRVM